MNRVQPRPSRDQQLSTRDGTVPRRPRSRRSVHETIPALSPQPTHPKRMHGHRPTPSTERTLSGSTGRLVTTCVGFCFLKSLEAPRRDSRGDFCDGPGRCRDDRTERTRKCMPVRQVFGKEGASRRVMAATRRLFTSRGRLMGRATDSSKRF